MTAPVHAGRSVAWLVLGKGAYFVMSFVVTALFARLLSPAEFGLMAIALLTMGLPIALFEGAIGVEVIRKQDLTDRDLSSSFWTSVVLGGLLYLALYVLAPWVAMFFRQTELVPLIRLVALAVLFRASESAPLALLQREGRHKWVAVFTTLAYFTGYCVVGLTMAWLHFGVTSMGVAVVVTALVEAALVLGAAGPRRFLSRMVLRDSAKVAGESLMLTLAQALNWLANSGSNIVTGRLLGVLELGLYARAWKLLDLSANAMGGPLRQVLLPMFAAARGDRDRLRLEFLDTLKTAIWLFVLVSAWLVGNAQGIVLLALGDKWSAAVAIVIPLFATVLPRCAFKVTEAMAVAMGERGRQALKQAIYAALTVGLAAVGANWGPVGVALGVSAAISIFYAISLWHAGHVAGVPFGRLLLLHLVPMALGALLAWSFMHGTALAVQHWGRLLGLSLGAATSGAALLAAFMLAPARVCGAQSVRFRSSFTQRLAGPLRGSRLP